MKQQRTSEPQRGNQRGAAALLVVVVLFFILALVTAYAGRNLIFEQRTSVNNQRASQAFELAESGIDYAIGLLGGGRVDDACLPTNDVTKTTFRDRHLTQDGDGKFIADGKANFRPTCMLLSTGPSCSCPSSAAPDLAPPVGLAPTFQLRFETGIAQPGVVRVVSKGCNSIGKQCYRDDFDRTADAVAEVSVLLGLNSALATPPSAALTVRGGLNLHDDAPVISNNHVASGGLTVHAGDAVTNTAGVRLIGLPGTPGSASMVASDSRLRELADDRLFKSVFGMDWATYRTQPAAVRVTCSADCGVDIAATASKNPGRVIWVDGPVTIGSNTVLGSPPEPPVMLLIRGTLTVEANLQLHGLLYLQEAGTPGATVWTTNPTSTVIHGAVVAEGNLSMSGAPTIVFNPDVLSTINRTQGSLVRIPGSWRDYTAGS
jgi:hypothetical protein